MNRTVHRLKVWTLVIIAAVFAALAWVVTLLMHRAGWPTPSLPYSALITLLVVMVCVFVLGWRVRTWQNGTRTRRLDPILAARTLVLAQSSAYAGALILGWHIGIAIDELNAVSYGAPLSVLGPPVAIVGGGLAMVIVGMVVEKFCQLPPEEGDEPDEGEQYAQSS